MVQVRKKIQFLPKKTLTKMQNYMIECSGMVKIIGNELVLHG